MRVVVDTNVLVAAVISRSGANREVLRRCIRGSLTPLVGAALFQEYESVLSRPRVRRTARDANVDVNVLLDAFLARAEWVRVYFLWRPNLADEADNHVLELAVAGGASALITNNIRDFESGDLNFPQLRIVSPRQALQEV